MLSAGSLRLRAGRWRKFQSVFFSNLHHPRNLLLLLRSQSIDFFKEPFEPGRRDYTHQTAGCLAQIAIGMWYSTRSKNCRPLLSDELFCSDSPLVFSLNNLKGFVFPVMDVRWGPTARHIVRLDRADHAAGIVAVNANNHRNT